MLKLHQLWLFNILKGDNQMRRKFSFFLALLIFVFTVSFTAFATENVTVTLEYTDTVVFGRHYGREITIDMYNNSWGVTNDVRMLDRDGDVVWEEMGAIEADGVRTFWCGPDVRKIQVKVRRTSIFGYFVSRCSCNVY